MADWTPVYTRAWSGTPGLTGLIDAIGTNDGVDAYVNPSPSIVTASQSTNQDGTRTAHKAFDHANTTNSEAHTGDTANSWWQVGFKTNGVILTHIGILNRVEAGYHPRHFKVQGSNEGSVWTDLLTVTGLTPFSNSWWDSAIESEETWRFIRIQQTGTNSNSSNHLVLGEVEFWGEYAEYTGPPAPTMVGHEAARVLRQGTDVPVRVGHTAARVLREQGGIPVRVGHLAIRVLRGLWEPPPPARPDDWGDTPTRDIDWWTIAQQQGGVPPTVELTVTVPGGVEKPLELLAGSVTKRLGTGYRYTAKVDVTPYSGVWALVTAPGAVFRITFGWQFGPHENQHVTRRMGVYLLGEIPKSSRGEPIELNLVDMWKRLEDTRFIGPWSSGVGDTRASVISGLINNSDTRLDLPIRMSADGGIMGRSMTVERDRVEAITTLARDGRFHVFFDNEGWLAFEPEAVEMTGRIVATFTDGTNSTILDVSRQVEFTRLYNAVRVNPITEGDNPQTWSPVTVHVADPEHERHRSKIGVIPGFFSSPTVTSQARAFDAAKTRLQSLLQQLASVEVETWARPDIEPGDVFSTIESATYASEQRIGTWLVEEIEFDLVQLGTRIRGRNSAVQPVEEEEV